jgi:HAD superfamily hydrolase (TIGR01549 family)
MNAVLFDFGGTLDFPRHWLDRFVAHYRTAGIDIGRADLAPAFGAATQEAYARSAMLRDRDLSALIGYLAGLQFEHLRERGSERLRKLLDAAPVRITEQLIRQIRDSFVAESALGFAISRPLLESISRDYKTAVVSNFYGNLDRILVEAGLAHSIAVVADSARIGFYKPDHRIFAAALEQLSVAPHEAVMVGDSIGKDCVPARALGMTTVWLRHREFFDRKVGPADSVDFTIDHLEELKDFAWLSRRLNQSEPGR